MLVDLKKYTFYQLPLMVTSCKTIAQYHNQDIDLDAIKIQKSSLTTRVPRAALLQLHPLFTQHTLKSLATTVISSPFL